MRTIDEKTSAATSRHRELYSQLLSASYSEELGRRDFLKVLGASIAFAGLSGCQVRQPVETIVPYVRQPEEVVPGKPSFYATAMSLGGYAIGLLVESHEGRPTKIEGNPLHPASLGATDVFAQASVLDLYDPDRSQTPRYLGEIRTWGDFLSDFCREVTKHRSTSGARLRILTETINSPSLNDQLKKLLTDFPQAGWHQFEPCNRDNVLTGMQFASGSPLEPVYHFDRANVVLSLDSDFLMSGPGSVRYARDFMSRRRVRHDKKETNRLYVVETTISNTGAVADHRLAVRPGDFDAFVQQLAGRLGVIGETVTSGINSEWLQTVARDLEANHGSSIALAGAQQSPQIHALVHQINQKLGNLGNTVTYIEPPSGNSASQLESLRQLVADIEAGQVDLLVILGGNPVLNAPVDFHFADSIAKIPLRVHHSLHYDETSALCHWHINAAHYLETWSDARAYDGTVSIVQPLIAPLYSGKTAHEILTAFTDQPERSSYELVRSYWMQSQSIAAGTPTASATPSPTSSPSPVQRQVGSTEFEQWWAKTLRDGIVENSSASTVNLTQAQQGNQSASLPITPAASTPATGNVEIVFLPDPSIYDGRFANNSWLQELPKPLTKLTWDNAAIISPNTARQFGLSTEPDYRGGEHGKNDVTVVELTVADRSLHAPVWIVPGQPDGVVTIHLGYGRTRAGDAGTSTAAKPVGFDAYQLRTSNGFWFTTGQLKKTELTYPLACTQAHYRMEGRELVRSASLGEYLQNPDFAKREADRKEEQVSLYPGWEYQSYAWGMSIDTGTCTGCNACVIACQSENNIPVVGKDEVMHAREMHWLRIDRYFEGDANNPETNFQPVPCMHCENAPCELVCPVEATSHSDEGLNEMTYNRCVGTRYCSNNCPYKVRRFNFFEYARFDSALVKLQRNPDVTVRSRGVMEKCTYCLQRISAAKIEAEKENRRVQDGEITTACQQVCPVDAIVFGNINDPNSRVAKLKQEPTDYGMLAELNTRPRTTYLARIRNPNPQLINIESRR